MEAVVTTRVEATLTTTFTEAEARALARLSQYSAESIAELLGKHITRDFEEGGDHYKGLVSLLISANRLNIPLKELTDGKAKIKTLKP